MTSTCTCTSELVGLCRVRRAARFCTRARLFVADDRVCLFRYVAEMKKVQCTQCVRVCQQTYKASAMAEQGIEVHVSRTPWLHSLLRAGPFGGMHTGTPPLACRLACPRRAPRSPRLSSRLLAVAHGAT